MGEAARILLGLLLAAIPAMAQTVEHLCSPSDNLERSELARLDTATRTVDVAMYSFTDRYLAEELATLARKGIRIRVYRDRIQFTQEMRWGAGTTTSILLAAGVEVRIEGAKDLMHLKSYSIDGRLLRSGPRTGLLRDSSARTTTCCTSRLQRWWSVLSRSSKRCGRGPRTRPDLPEQDSDLLTV